MGKKPKKKSKQGSKHPADKRPVQLIVFLVILSISAFGFLYLWHFYANVVGGNSVPVSAEALPTYRTVLLISALLNFLICILLFLGLKAGFWIAVVLNALSLVNKALSLELFQVCISGLYLYLLLCQPTRIYFRIGQFKAFGPREK